MRNTLTLLIASTALTAAIDLPVLGAMQGPDTAVPRSISALFKDGARALPMLLASDHDDDHDRGHGETSKRDRDEDEDEDEDEDDRGRSGGARNPAPAGATA
jgi:hypothetical protein